MNTHLTGNVFDPASEKFKKGYIRVRDGFFALQLEEWLVENEVYREVDCTDMMIVPGLIDLHVHVFHDATMLGVEPDKSCLER